MSPIVWICIKQICPCIVNDFIHLHNSFGHHHRRRSMSNIRTHSLHLRAHVLSREETGLEGINANTLECDGSTENNLRMRELQCENCNAPGMQSSCCVDAYKCEWVIRDSWVVLYWIEIVMWLNVVINIANMLFNIFSEFRYAVTWNVRSKIYRVRIVSFSWL